MFFSKHLKWPLDKIHSLLFFVVVVLGCFVCLTDTKAALLYSQDSSGEAFRNSIGTGPAWYGGGSTPLSGSTTLVQSVAVKAYNSASYPNDDLIVRIKDDGIVCSDYSVAVNVPATDDGNWYCLSMLDGDSGQTRCPLNEIDYIGVYGSITNGADFYLKRSISSVVAVWQSSQWGGGWSDKDLAIRFYSDPYCGEPYCGDSVCNGSETWLSCPDDCGVTSPSIVFLSEVGGEGYVTEADVSGALPGGGFLGAMSVSAHTYAELEPFDIFDVLFNVEVYSDDSGSPDELLCSLATWSSGWPADGDSYGGKPFQLLNIYAHGETGPCSGLSEGVYWLRATEYYDGYGSSEWSSYYKLNVVANIPPAGGNNPLPAEVYSFVGFPVSGGVYGVDDFNNYVKNKKFEGYSTLSSDSYPDLTYSSDWRLFDYDVSSTVPVCEWQEWLSDSSLAGNYRLDVAGHYGSYWQPALSQCLNQSGDPQLLRFKDGGSYGVNVEYYFDIDVSVARSSTINFIVEGDVGELGRPFCSVWGGIWSEPNDGDGLACVWSWLMYVIVPTDEFADPIVDLYNAMSDYYPTRYVFDLFSPITELYSTESSGCPSWLSFVHDGDNEYLDMDFDICPILTNVHDFIDDSPFETVEIVLIGIVGSLVLLVLCVRGTKI